MVKSVAQQYRKLKKSLDEWVADPYNSIQRPANVQENLRAAVAAKDQGFFRGNACLALLELAVFEHRFGTQGVLEGGPESWSRLHASPRLKVIEYSISTLTGFLAEMAALTLSHLYCIGETSIANNLGQVMFEEFVEHHRTKRKSAYTYDRYVGMALYFWAQENRDAKAANQILPTIKHKVFRSIIDGWNLSTFEQVLMEACDYHVMHAWKDDDDFAWSPYDLMPIEVLWIKRLRLEQGLPMPTPAHVLLESPLYTEFDEHKKAPLPSNVENTIESIKTGVKRLEYPLRFPSF